MVAVPCPLVAGGAAERETDASLRIRIHQQYVPPAAREGMAEVDADGGLSDPSFLTGCGEGNHAADVSGLCVLCMKMLSVRTLLRQNSLLESANCLSSP